MERIRIIGVGWEEKELTLGALEWLRCGEKVVLRTGRCGCAEWLRREGIAFETMDALYDQCEDFDELIDRTARLVLQRAEVEPVVYCVSDLTDSTCVRLTELAEGRVDVMAGPMEGGCLTAFQDGALRMVSAADADGFVPDVRSGTLVRELASPMLAGDMKLRLMEYYPEEMEIYLLDADGKIVTIPLCEMDRLPEYDHRMCALIPAVRDLNRLERFDFRHLGEIMRRLRDEEEGCPWDREQTHESLRPYLVEEAYEAAEAIDQDDPDALYDELGDVLLQVAFHAEIARQYGEFEPSDITTAICRKMIRRHPHVFGSAHADTSEDVHALWESVKRKEKALCTEADLLRSTVRGLPALMRASKVCGKVMNRGAVLPDVKTAWQRYTEEPDELRLGDLLLALSGAAKQADQEPEIALAGAVNRWIDRFTEEERENGSGE